MIRPQKVNVMNIVFTLNDAFVPQVATCMASIMDNTKPSAPVHFYLIHIDISQNNQKKLELFCQTLGCQVSFIELGDLATYFDFTFDTNGWSPIVLARLIMDKLLPETVERLIYLDGDTLALGDISSLWNIDLGDKILGMAPEPTVDKVRYTDLDLAPYPYHNAGVLLIDLKKWREQRIGYQVLSYYQSKEGNLFANDQDAINASLKEKIQTVSIAYNYFNIYDTYPHRVLKRLSQPAAFMDKVSYENAKAKPLIVHYLGEERPWRRWNTHRYRKVYRDYWQKTPWRDTPLEEGWRLYFCCFAIFNTLMKPFPMLRYKIINGLIPLMMTYRKRQLRKK